VRGSAQRPFRELVLQRRSCLMHRLHATHEHGRCDTPAVRGSGFDVGSASRPVVGGHRGQGPGPQRRHARVQKHGQLAAGRFTQRFAISRPALPANRGRRAGTGRRRQKAAQPGLLDALGALVEPSSRGDPESPTRWTCKGGRRRAAELCRQGFTIGRPMVAELLGDVGLQPAGQPQDAHGQPTSRS
jgi:hypothetical protein